MTEIVDEPIRMPVLSVEFCGEIFQVLPGTPFVIGREGQLEIDDNPYLHRRFLQVSDHGSLWWLGNVGSALTATVADEAGTMQAWLAPGAQLPIVFDRTVVWFTAGPTTYELSILVQEPPFMQINEPATGTGDETIGPMTFTPDQLLLILALCESMLRDGARGAGSIPSSAVAAERLGWKLTRFNRKLDNVCEKLTRSGIRGLHGGPDKLAVNRRARLVEYALAARLVEKSDLDLLDGLAGTS